MVTAAQQDAIQQAICHVGGPRPGTGYLVAARLVATCEHVIRGKNKGDLVEVTFCRGSAPLTAHVESIDATADAALLRLGDDVGVAPLVFAEACCPGDEFWGFGFPAQIPTTPGSLGGTIVAPRLASNGQRGAVELVELSCDEARDDIRGWSGSPILVGAVVVGHVRSYWQNGQTGDPLFNKLLATPARAVRALAPADIRLPPPLDGYFRHLERTTAWLDLQGFAQGREVARRRIEALYTPLRFRATGQQVVTGLPARLRERGGGAGKEGVRDAMEPLREERGGRLADILPPASKLLVVGAAGSGKTTFLRLAACMLARDALAETAGPGGVPWRAMHLGLAAEEPCPTPLFASLAHVRDRLSKIDGERELTRERLLEGIGADEGGKARRRERDAARAALESGRAMLLLDGLDEVADPVAREKLRKVLEDALSGWQRSRIVMTSRPFETGPFEALGFTSAHVEPFHRPQVGEMLDRWVATLSGTPPGYREELEAAMVQRDEIRRLAESPVMLTCLCVVHWNDRELPRGRAEAYRKIVDWLITSRRMKRKAAGFSQGLALQGLPALATAMTLDPRGKRSTITMADAAHAVETGARNHARKLGDHAERIDKLDAWLRWERAGSGLFQQLGPGTLRFWHLTFQEFLTAETLATWRDDSTGDGAWWPVLGKHLHDPQWAEVVALFPACLVPHGEHRVTLLLERVVGLLGPNPDLGTEGRVFAVLHRMIDSLRLYEEYALPPEIHAEHERLRQRVQGIFAPGASAILPWRERLAVAEALGEAGDDRLEVPIRQRMRPIAPGARVLLGIYPVTVQEYAAFVDTGGYATPRYWGRAWALRTEEKWSEPDGWSEQSRARNRPVTGVSWFEALAYCNWLRERTGLAFRLPAEDEWERAATAPEDGRYAWGDAEPTPELANYGESGLHRPTPVGLYPDGARAEGHLDLAGNVWEWCVDKDVDVSVNTMTGLLPLLSAARSLGPPIRGGCFWNVAEGLRSSGRSDGYAWARGDNVGLRLALSAA